MRTFKTYKEIYQHHSGFINVQNLLNGRGCLKRRDWDFIRLIPELREQLCKDIARVLGGDAATKRKIVSVLQNTKPPIQHWGLQRMWLLKAKKYDLPRVVYGLTNDPTSQELTEVRNELKRNNGTK